VCSSTSTTKDIRSNRMGIATLEFLQAKKDSSSSEGSDFCRICHCGAEVEELISPCHCSGSLGFIHQTCLQEWLGSTNKKVCELCRYEFKLHATLRPLNKWRLLSLSRYERRKIVCSVTFHLLAITCVVWSIWVLLQRLIQEAGHSELGWAFWTKVVVVIIGFIGGLSFVFAQVKMYYNLIKRWRSFNKIILVVDKSEPEDDDTEDHRASSTQHTSQPPVFIV